MLLASGFPLVALDLGLPPLRGGRGVEAAWLRLARAARAHDAALLVGSPYRVSGTAAAAVLKAAGGRAAWQRRRRLPPPARRLHRPRRAGEVPRAACPDRARSSGSLRGGSAAARPAAAPAGPARAGDPTCRDERERRRPLLRAASA